MFSKLNQVIEILYREVGIYDKHHRDRDELRDRCEIAQRVIAKRLVEVGIDRKGRAPARDKGVTIGRRLRADFGS